MTFLNHIKEFGSKIAIKENMQNYSYLELSKKSEKNCMKISKRSLVFLLANNDIDSISFYLGLLKKKSVVTFINPLIEILQLRKLTQIYKPNYIVSSHSTLKLKGYNFLLSVNNYNILKRKKIFKHRINKELGLLMSTSGTTGSPKFVRLSYKNYKDNTDKIIKSLSIKFNDTVMTTLPINYSYGLSVINSYLSVGATIFLNNFSILNKRFWDDYKLYRPTSFYGVPFIYEILKKLNYKNFYTKNLKFFANAGGKIDQKTLKENIIFSKRKKLKFYQMYGQTEASPRISLLDDKFKQLKFNSIGKPLSGGKLALFDENNKKITKPFIKGELIYYGKNVSLGYALNYKDLIKGNTNKFRLFTGDIAYFDKNKFFYILGRKSNFIKIFGHRIDLDYLENFLTNKGIKLKCSNIDDQLLLFYKDKKIQKKKIVNLLFKEFKINKNIIKFEYIKSIHLKNKKFL